MIRSRLILDILDLALETYEFEDLARKQIPFLTIEQYEHTGVGLYIYFGRLPGIEAFRIPAGADQRLGGVELSNAGEGILADTDTQISDGYIDCIEIWNKCGEDYPETEPSSYTLEQIWIGKIDPKKIVRP